MTVKKIASLLVFSLALLAFQRCAAQDANPENWTANQLLPPATLAHALETSHNVPLIYCVGPGAVIPHSIDIGMTKDSQNLQKFRKALQKVPRNADLVIYCGCCPFSHCPDVRPAINLLKEMKFTNYHLLDLPNNIKTDWISKGYPQTKP